MFPAADMVPPASKPADGHPGWTDPTQSLPDASFSFPSGCKSPDLVSLNEMLIISVLVLGPNPSSSVGGASWWVVLGPNVAIAPTVVPIIEN